MFGSAAFDNNIDLFPSIAARVGICAVGGDDHNYFVTNVCPLCRPLVEEGCHCGGEWNSNTPSLRCW